MNSELVFPGDAVAIAHDLPAPARALPSAPPSSSLKQLPRTEEWISLPEPYSHMRVLVWVDFPQRLLDQLQAQDQAAVRAVAQQIVLAHDGWADDDGPLPPPSEDAFWDRISLRLMVRLFRAVIDTATAVPNSTSPPNSA